jgi:hypothetical protein
MKILFLSDNFIPETNAPAYRTFEHCREWVKQGVEVTVISCFPNFPHGKVYEGYKNKLYQVEFIEGIRVIRVWSFMAENKGFVKRVLDFCSFMISSFVAGLFIKTDLIIATSPQFFTAISGKWLAFWKRRKWIMEVRDLWPESLKVVGVMNDNIFIRFFELIEHRLYKSAWKLVTVTNYMKQEIQTKHRIADTKIKVIRNGADFDEFQPLPKNRELISRLGLANKYIIGYVGTHGLAHGLAFILECAAKLKSDKVHFLFVGSGAEKPNLIRLQKELQLSNVTFLEPVPKNEVKEYLSILDAGLVNLIKSPVFMGALPSKINELVAMGIPILLGVEGEAEEFVGSNGLGVCFEPENEESFIHAVDQMLDKKNDFWGNGSKEVKNLIDRKELADQMLAFIRK